MQEIEITIDENGEITLDLEGFQGKGCAEITQKIVKAMKGVILDSKKKPAYYKPAEKHKLKISRGT